MKGRTAKLDFNPLTKDQRIIYDDAAVTVIHRLGGWTSCARVVSEDMNRAVHPAVVRRWFLERKLPMRAAFVLLEAANARAKTLVTAAEGGIIPEDHADDGRMVGPEEFFPWLRKYLPKQTR